MFLRATKRILQTILWPPFPVVFALSATCLTAFAAWIYFDPWFPMIFDLLKPAETGPGERVSYDFLRPTFQARVNWFVALRILAIVLAAIAVVQLFVGARSGRSISAWLWTTALLGAWLGFLLNYERIQYAGYRARTREKLTELQTLADAINSHRLGTEVQTEIGIYGTDPLRMPNTFYHRVQWWTSNNPFFVLRLMDGGLLILFSAPSRLFVEYHPNDNEPSVKHIPDNTMPLVLDFTELTHSESLGDGWYLTAYDEQ